MIKLSITFLTIVFYYLPLAAQVETKPPGNLRSENQLIRIEKEHKELSKELPASASPKVIINCKLRNYEIKTWDDNKVKIVIDIQYDKELKHTDNELWEKANTSLSGDENIITVQLGEIQTIDNYLIKIASGGSTLTGTGSPNTSHSLTLTGRSPGTDKDSTHYGGKTLRGAEAGKETGKTNILNNATIQGYGKVYTIDNLVKLGKRADKDVVTTIYVPKNSTLQVKGSYGDVVISADVLKLDAVLESGNLYARDINDFTLSSRSSGYNIRNIAKAKLDLEEGSFIAGNVSVLDIESKSAYVELAAVDHLSIVSSINDEYEIDRVGALSGKKKFGKLRIDTLAGTLSLEGANADIKIKAIVSATQSITIDDQFARISLPVKDIENFAVEFSGLNSVVYASDNRIGLVNNAQEANPDRKTPGLFTLAAGNQGKNYTKFQLKCPNCSINLR